MPEWVSEEGIGETRMALVDGDEILAARILPDGIAPAGTTLHAKLIGTGRSTVARDADGIDYLLPKGAPGLSEGAAVEIVITRSAIPGTEPWKRPLAMVAGADDRAPDLVEAIVGELPPSWNDLIEEARSGVVRFAGGELRISPTPAMTLIDVDGWLPPEQLATLGAAEAARAVRRLDIGGSIGIDLPTAGSKAARQAAAAAIDAILPKPFERTAVNGFGFVQIVRPRVRPSLLEIWSDRAAAEARALLRRAALSRTGDCRLAAHPAVIAVLERHPGWIDALARQVGGPVGLRADTSRPISAGDAEPA